MTTAICSSFSLSTIENTLPFLAKEQTQAEIPSTWGYHGGKWQDLRKYDVPLSKRKIVKIASYGIENKGYDVERILNEVFKVKNRYRWVFTQKDPDIVLFGVRKETKDFQKDDYQELQLDEFYAFPRAKTALSSRYPNKPTFLFYTPENVRPLFKECDFAISFIRDYPMQNFRFPYYAYLLNKDLSKLHLKPVEAKSKFCHFIYSWIGNPDRELLFNKLNAYKEVTSPGKALNNAPAIEKNTPKMSRSWKPREDYWHKIKANYIKQFKFGIACENSYGNSESGYVTEKLLDIFLARSIPIYMGDSQAAKDFNPRAFISYSDFKEKFLAKNPQHSLSDEALKDKVMTLMLNRIKQIDQNPKLYAQYLKEPVFPNNKVTSFVDYKALWQFIDKVVAHSKKTK